MQFELLRLSVLPRPQIDGFERKKADGTPFTREEWLREVFGTKIPFVHRGETFHYVPVPNPDPQGRELISGRIGRQVVVLENESPDADLDEVERPSWRAAMVTIDPYHHADGQKAGVEFIAKIGKPIPLFESLANGINERTEPYLLEANAIVATETFWDFANTNAGQVVNVEFEFVAPNMFGGAEDYDLEMKDMQENEKVQKAKIVIESKDGLNLDTDRVKSAANYTSRGTGSIKARTKAGKVYDSKSKAKRVKITKKEIDNQTPRSLLTWLGTVILRQT